MKSKTLIFNILVLLISIIISIVVIEITVRQIDPIQFAKNRQYILTDNSIFSYKPNYAMSYDRPEFPVDIKINSKGLRDYEYSYEKDEGVKRIAMIGDSFIAAIQLPLEKTATKKIEQRVNKNARDRYEVLNMGFNGQGPTALTVFLEKEAIRYDPDIIVFNIYLGNDISKIDIGISGSIPSEIFEYNDDLENYEFEVTKVQKVKNMIFRNYFTYSYTREFINKIKYGQSIDPAFVESVIYQKKYPAYINGNLEKLEVILKHLKRYSEERELKLLVVLIPSKEQVDRGQLLEIIEKYDMNESQLDMNKIQKLILKMGEENDILMLDLLPEFLKQNGDNSLHFDIDAHWNEKGNELAANLIYEKLIKSGLVAP